MKYLTKIYWSDEDEAYVAEVPSLPGCIAHGSSYEQAARHIRLAMELWLGSAKRHHDPIPEPDLVAEEVMRLAPLINMSKLAQLSGINKHTLATKLRRKTRFTFEESTKIRTALATI
ncbi:MAG: type II toxin-antitoxin system HicB family antitoxin [Chthoniobacterales bacterium]|nr:type II toxin-antitoxin system HicB family antitoxin [Chthoniobacterales bacterium]